MNLEDFGYNPLFEKYRTDNNLNNFDVGRIILEHRERYVVKTAKGEYEAEITGNMRFTAKSREDFPAIGDWVAIATYDSDFAIIHNIFPRYSIIKRQAIAQFGGVQIIATNIDYAFLVQATDRDFNINRLERYITICNSSRVKPIIVLSKTDLISKPQVDSIVEEIKLRIKHIPIIAISSETMDGYKTLSESIEKGKTYCLLGSSGVGKSTLLNRLSGSEFMKTSHISHSTSKGRHVTSHRELIVLDGGGILIDNPGMREVGIADTDNGLEMTFDIILQFSKNCKFKDCTHTHESGCAVIEAVNKGDIDKSSYNNFLRMEKEKHHFESTLSEKRKKDKELSRILKNYKKDMRRNQL